MILGNGKYQVLEDGIIINNDNGAIMRPLEKRKGKKAKPHYLLKLDNGRTQWYSVDWLIKHYHELNNLEVVEYTPLPDGVEPSSDLDISKKGLVQSILDDLDEL